MNEKEEAMPVQTPFEELLQVAVAALDHPDYVVRLKAEARYAAHVFGTDFTRELVRRGAAAPALYEALSGLLAMAEDLAATFPITPSDDGVNVIERARAALSAAKQDS